MQKQLNVLMLPKWFPGYMDPAEGNYIYRHIKAIGESCKVVVLYVHSQDKKNGYEIIEETDGRIHVIRIYFNRSFTGIKAWDKLINFFRFMKAQKKGYRLYREKHGTPDIVHVHSLTRTCLLAARIKKKETIPFIISEHWSGFLEERNIRFHPLKKYFILHFSGKADTITCVSQKLKEGMEHFGFKNRIVIIPNVCDLSVFYPSHEDYPGRSKHFVHISRLDDHTKNFGGILRAFAQAVKKNPGLHLHVFGDGEERQKQQEASHRAGLEKNITFYGYQPQKKIAEQLRRSAALIVFSHYESQSCAIIESFACGVPVIATNTGGIPELVNEERGILIEKSDENALCGAIIKISSNEILFQKNKIADYSHTFGIGETSSAFTGLYRKALAKSLQR